MNTPTKTYLGDSVYVDFDPSGGVVLTTWNGYGDSNTIILEPEVLANLLQWIGAAKADKP